MSSYVVIAAFRKTKENQINILQGWDGCTNWIGKI